MSRFYPTQPVATVPHQAEAVARWPETWEEWQDEYSRREDYYRGEGYSLEEVKHYGLFRALDDDGKVISLTRQLTRDVQHVIDTDAAALSAGLVLEADDATPEQLQLARSVWKRSQWQARSKLAAHNLCQHGRVGLEAYLGTDRKGRIQLLDARHYRCEYADDGVTLSRVWIVIPYFDAPHLSTTGEPEGGTVPHTYVRELTRSEVRTWIDGALDPAQSGPHGLGEVPFANGQFLPAGDSEHGLWAAHGLASPLALYDSLYTQIQAVGNRRANPIPWLKGARLDSASAVDKFGRWITGLPPDGEVGYLESDLRGLAVLLESANTARLNARETLPEFLFAGAGAQASGDALRWRAGAFELKIRSIREGYFSQIARITDLAVRYEQRQAYAPEEDLYRVEAAPVLPPDKAAELSALEAAGRLGMRRADQVRHLQRLGLIESTEDADEYALNAADETGERALTFFRDRQRDQ